MTVHLPAQAFQVRSAIMRWIPLLALAGFMGGCADQAMDPDRKYPVRLGVAASVPSGAQAQLAEVDAWRVQLIRAGAGVVAEDFGTVTPEQVSVTIELSLTLLTPCELLTLRIELSADGEVWFLSETPQEICIGRGNDLQVQELAWVGALIGLSSSGLTFSLEKGDSPEAASLTLSNPGGGALDWTASDDREWILVSPASGTLAPSQSVNLQVTVSDPGSGQGDYQGTITVSGANAFNSPQTVPVSLGFVWPPTIGLSPGALGFVIDERIDPEPATIIVTNSGGAPLTWSASDNAPWLSVSPSGGTLSPGASQVLTAAVTAGELAPGTYGGLITVSGPEASNSPQSMSVELVVRPRPVIGVPHDPLSFSTTEGEDPPSQTMTVTNDGGGILNWSVTDGGAGWLQVSPTSGSLGAGDSQELVVSVSAADLGLGTYQEVLTFSDPGALNSPTVLPVALNVTTPPVIGLSTSLISVSSPEGMNAPAQLMSVSNQGGGVLEWTATTDVGWIDVTPLSGTLGAGLAQYATVSFETAGLGVGTYQGVITFSDPDAGNSPQTVMVSLEVNPRSAPVISDLRVILKTLNDPTCPLVLEEYHGSRFWVRFDFTDEEGDLPIQPDGSFEGNPVQFVSSFPDYSTTTTYTTATVAGTSTSGRATFEICVVFDFHNGVNTWVRLFDDWGLASNQLYRYTDRPPGAYSPPESASGSGAVAQDRSPGGVLTLPGNGGR